MKGEKGVSLRASFEVEHLEYRYHTSRILLVILPILLGACVHWPDIASDCDAYGVLETHQPMGYFGRIEPLSAKELDRHCAPIKKAVAWTHPGATIKGCVIPRADGSVSAYYSVGDRCARNHELCHVMHGPGHTSEYREKADNNHPRPYCPENQLTFLALTP